jgi:hypothetical protein
MINADYNQDPSLGFETMSPKILILFILSIPVKQIHDIGF